MQRTFSVVGGDARQQAAGRWLEKQGCTVTGAEEVYRADYILLPMPLDAHRVGLARLLRAARPGTVAFGGRVSEAVQAAGQAAGIPIWDYYRCDQLAQWNAVPTAEGCLALLLQNRPRTLWGSNVLVVDLASEPGGTDFAAARALGVRAMHALSLPARFAPETAGELVGRTVLQMIREREEGV